MSTVPTTPKKKKHGEVIRVSELLYYIMEKERPQSVSWDAFLRARFGLPARGKRRRDAKFVYLLESTKQIFSSLPEARGAAVVNAVKAKRKRPEEPLRFRESS